MLEDNYNHLEIEDKIYNFWESNRLFEPKKNSNKKKYFSIKRISANLRNSGASKHGLLFYRFISGKGTYRELCIPVS